MQYLQDVLNQVKEANANEPEFFQAVEEVFHSLEQVVQDGSDFQKQAILVDIWQY